MQIFLHTVKSLLSVCALEASGFPFTLVYAECWARIDFQTIRDVANCYSPDSQRLIVVDHRGKCTDLQQM